MLKIKDDISLKELEKFGFEVFGEHSARKNFYDDFLEDDTFILIDNRTIWLVQNNACQSNERYFGNPQGDTLFDLIQAGLVIKV